MQASESKSSIVNNEVERSLDRLNEIEQVLSTLEFKSVYGKISIAKQFPKIRWIQLCVALACFLVWLVADDGKSLFAAACIMFGLSAVDGFSQRMIFNVRTHAWKPQLALLQLEINKLRRSAFGKRANYHFDLSAVNTVLCRAKKESSFYPGLEDGERKLYLSPTSLAVLTEQELKAPLEYIDVLWNVRQNEVVLSLLVKTGSTRFNFYTVTQTVPLSTPIFFPDLVA